MLEPVSNKSRESQLAAPETEKPSLTIHQKVRYAVQILTNVGNKERLILHSIPPTWKKMPTVIAFNVAIRNTGTRHSRPEVWLDVFNAQGDNIGKLAAETHGLYSGEREMFNINLDSLKVGSYKALLAAKDNNSGQVFGSDINLTVQP